MMLREGWDVQSVTVIVGLRPYTSKANILPEQTVGRGLRLMFRGATGYVERVDVIGNKTFIEFVEQLEREEDIQLETFKLGEKVQYHHHRAGSQEGGQGHRHPGPEPDPDPQEIAGRGNRRTRRERIQLPDPAAQAGRCSPQDSSATRATTSSRCRKLIERDYTIPEPQTAEEVIGYYARRIAQDVKLPSQFAALAPKVREFLETKAFGERVDAE